MSHVTIPLKPNYELAACTFVRRHQSSSPKETLVALTRMLEEFFSNGEARERLVIATELRAKFATLGIEL